LFFLGFHNLFESFSEPVALLLSRVADSGNVPGPKLDEDIQKLGEEF
jgi:hypothetical protein